MDAKPVPRVSDSAGQGGTQVCISNKFPRDAAAAVLTLTLTVVHKD